MFAWVVIVGAVLAIAGLATMLVRGLGQTPLVIVLIVLAFAAVVYLWRFALHPRVVFDERLWVVNPMHTHILDATEVSDVTPGPDGLLVRHGDGVVEAWAVQKSSSALRDGRRTRADEVADQLLTAIRTASAADPAPATELTTEPETEPETQPTPDPETQPSGEPAAAEAVPADADADAAAATSDRSTEPVAVGASSSPVTPAAAVGPSNPSNPSNPVSPLSPVTVERAPEPALAAVTVAPHPDTDWPTLELPITLPARSEAAPSPATDRGTESAQPGESAVPAEPARHEPGQDEADQDDDDDTDDLIIRRASPTDLDILVGLEKQISGTALGHVFGDTPFPTDQITERWSAALRDRGVKVRIAEIDGDPVGYLCYDQQQLRHVGLVPAHTGRGHGRSLVEYAVGDMFSRGVDRVELQVLEDNTAARGFYRHLGWAETQSRTPSVHPPHPIELTLTYQGDRN